MLGTNTGTQTKPWAPKFFTIWGGQALSLLGSELVQFALIWWLTKSSGSGTVLAMASLCWGRSWGRWWIGGIGG
jgi:hypothetical protein